MEERLESLRRSFGCTATPTVYFERRIELKGQEVGKIVQCSRARVSAFQSLAHENLIDGRTAKKGPK